MKKILAACLLAFMLLVNVTPVFASDGSQFKTQVKWTGSDIEISWENFRPNADVIRAMLEIRVYNKTTGKTATCQGVKVEDKILLSEARWTNGTSIAAPQEGEEWEITFSTPAGNRFSKSVTCTKENIVQKDLTEFHDNNIPIFDGYTWPIVMFWYKILASLSGVFIFFTLIRCGYQYMHTQNAGMRASVIGTIQKCVLGLVFIMVVPTFINLLIQVNDGLVHLCLNALNQLTTGTAEIDTSFVAAESASDWWGSILSWPFQLIIDLIKKVFGLNSLGAIIFNHAPSGTILSDKLAFAGQIKTANPFTDALMNLAFIGFTVYYNAVYTIRKWVVIAMTAVAPLIIWIWVLSEKREVMEIWLAEVIQTIFMQTFHALSFGIIFSILCRPDNIQTLLQTALDTGDLAAAMVRIGIDIAYFTGIVCAGIIVFQCYKLIVTTDEKAREEAQSTLARTMIGMVIIGLSLLIASYITGGNNLPIIAPDGISGERQKITLWGLFFALLTIVPVSKMLSSIFMTLLTRAGTVDEDKWAGRSLGMLGGMVLLTRTSAGAMRGGGANVLGGAQGVANSGQANSAAAGATGATAYAQSMNLLNSREHMTEKEKLKNSGLKLGMATGAIASPAVGMAMGGLFGVTAATAGTASYAAKAMVAGTDLFSKDKTNTIPLNERIRDYTGRDTTTGGAVQMASGVMLSPLGPKMATAVPNVLGKAVDKGGGIIDALNGRKTP